jgi:signal transduction histidine kinase
LISDEVARFQSLVVDLIELARSDHPVERGPVRAVELARQLAAEHDLSAGSVQGDPDAVWNVDRRRVEQILSNLLDNAAKYGGGPVAVRLLPRPGGYRLEVDDAGPGVGAADKATIFQRFVRGRAAQARGSDDGTGLGLALVAEHAAAHGGSVSVLDRPGGGARFRVDLGDGS